MKLEGNFKKRFLNISNKWKKIRIWWNNENKKIVDVKIDKNIAGRRRNGEVDNTLIPIFVKPEISEK